MTTLDLIADHIDACRPVPPPVHKHVGIATHHDSQPTRYLTAITVVSALIWLDT